MLKLSYRQLLVVTEVGRTLQRWQRDSYLRALADELASCKVIGDGNVHAAACKARRTVEVAHWARQQRSTEAVVDGTGTGTARERYEQLIATNPKFKLAPSTGDGVIIVGARPAK